MTYIFLDTNIFLHFRDFEEIDWAKLVSEKGPITIGLAPMVIDELDKHKYNINKKISKRVKNLLPRLESFIENPTLSRYAIIYLHSRPLEDIYILGHWKIFTF